MKISLIEDWRRIAPKLWSVRLSILAAVAASAQAGFEYFMAGQKPIIAVVAAVLALGSAVSRIISQPGLIDDQPTNITNQ